MLCWLLAGAGALFGQSGQREQFLERYARPGDEAATGIAIEKGAVYYLAGLRADRHGQLAEQGIRIVRRLDARHAIIRFDDDRPAAAQLEAVLAFAHPANDRWKLAGGAGPAFFPTNCQLIVSDESAFRRQLPALAPGASIRYRHGPSGVLALHVPDQQAFERILASPLVTFIVPTGQRHPTEERALGGLDFSVNQVRAMQAAYPDLTGEGLTVSVKEYLFDTTDIDFHGRIDLSPAAGTIANAHAAIMATIIAGGGNTFHTGHGVAWRSRLTASGFEELLPDPPALYDSLEVSVQNHSYGVGIENYYGADAAAYDASVIERPTLLHIFSAGNAGGETSQEGPYAGVDSFANLTGSFKMAKNILTVGALATDGSVARRSSRGPAYDSRLKPELAAFGQEGSSGAAAIVSGIALILQEAYREQHGVLPPAALLRAALLGSADDLGPPGPDLASGYGSANAYRAVQVIDREQYFGGRLRQGEAMAFPLEAPPGIRNLKVTLAWDDPPATPNSYRALVHDLDLELYHSATRQTWSPWVLRASPHPDSLALPARRGRDSLNNAEQVSLPDPPAGRYEIRIHGRAIPGDVQSFSVAYHWDEPEQLRWVYPAATDFVEPERPATLRWNSTLTAATAELQVSYDLGGTWRTLMREVQLADGAAAWDVPDTVAVALLRLQAGNQAYTSDTFTIAPDLALKVGFNCLDSVLFYWDALPGAREYRLFRLGEQYMDPFSTTTDTFIVLDKKQLSGRHLAVMPVRMPAHPFVRSTTLDYSTQGVGCYFRSFLANLTADYRGRLQLSIGTGYQVEDIVFEKWRNGGWQVLCPAIPGGSLEFACFDDRLEGGINSYRAALSLRDGRIVYSEIDEIFYPGDVTHLVYPNPVDGSGNLEIFVRQPVAGDAFQLFNAAGQQVRSTPLGANYESLELQALPPGVYFYRISKGPERKKEGKLVVW